MAKPLCLSARRQLLFEDKSNLGMYFIFYICVNNIYILKNMIDFLFTLSVYWTIQLCHNQCVDEKGVSCHMPLEMKNTE